MKEALDGNGSRGLRGGGAQKAFAKRMTRIGAEGGKIGIGGRCREGSRQNPVGGLLSHKRLLTRVGNICTQFPAAMPLAQVGTPHGATGCVIDDGLGPAEGRTCSAEPWSLESGLLERHTPETPNPHPSLAESDSLRRCVPKGRCTGAPRQFIYAGDIPLAYAAQPHHPRRFDEV